MPSMKSTENLKTGASTLSESAGVQLAVYRLAWARLKGIDPALVSAAFHYVPISKTDRPADLLTEDQLIKLITEIK
jgi:DNA helicase II / ATP-dependent DNA helicase PcrA